MSERKGVFVDVPDPKHDGKTHSFSVDVSSGLPDGIAEYFQQIYSPTSETQIAFTYCGRSYVAVRHEGSFTILSEP